MSESKSGFHGSFDEWLGRLPTPEGQSFAVASRRTVMGRKATLADDRSRPETASHERLLGGIPPAHTDPYVGPRLGRRRSQRTSR